MLLTLEARRGLIEPGHPDLSIRRQCELLGLNRSSYYLEPAVESLDNLRLMRAIDQRALVRPSLGSRGMTDWLRRQGEKVNRKRIQRLMRIMGLEAVYPKPRTTQPAPEDKAYPYLLRELKIDRINQVWSSDITYIPMQRGYMYLTAVMDWHSRYVLSWRLSNTMDGRFCLEALEDALSQATPEIFNSDQGAQFTATEYAARLLQAGAKISRDGRGRALDNVFIERLWRTVKYEDIYLKGYEDGASLAEGLKDYFRYYNRERGHQGLKYQTPWEVYGKHDDWIQSHPNLEH